MPELPEVETVRRTLERQILNKTITDVKVYYERMLENCTKEDFISTLGISSLIFKRIFATNR